MPSFQFLFLLFEVRFIAIVLAKSLCRYLNADPCWPALAVWQQFISSIGGRFINVSRLAKPCHDPDFQFSECQAVQKNWRDGYWRADQPGVMQLVNWEGLPTGRAVSSQRSQIIPMQTGQCSCLLRKCF
jgi:hypothetical protein